MNDGSSPPAPSRAGHLTGLLQRRLGQSFLLSAEPGDDEDRVQIDRSALPAVLAFCRRDPDSDLDVLVDLTAVDRGTGSGQKRYEVVLRLRSSRLGYRLRIGVPLADDDPSFPTCTTHYDAADWLEREVHDLFGIFPDGHPYLRRLLLYPGFAGHPLRRDYPALKDQPLVALRKSEVPPLRIDKDGREVKAQTPLAPENQPPVLEEGPLRASSAVAPAVAEAVQEALEEEAALVEAAAGDPGGEGDGDGGGDDDGDGDGDDDGHDDGHDDGDDDGHDGPRGQAPGVDRPTDEGAA